MRWFSKFAVAAACAFLQACATPPAVAPLTPSAVTEARQPVTILISIDAFRPDYLAHGNTPNLDALAAGGVQATMRPSYPTLTFPNHTTLVTGLRPDHHGIVANTFRDPARPGEKFYNKDLSALDPFWWAQEEPLWITAEKAGIRSGTMFWPGEEAAHGNVRPSDWARFDPNFTSAQRVLTLEDWMRRPAALRPKFMTLYFDDVDKTGHKQGPMAPETIAAVRHIDALIGGLRDTLSGLGQPVNFVIVSDHGMRDVEPDKAVLLQKILPSESYDLVFYGPLAAIAPKPGHEEAVARALTAPNPLMTCWRKADVPAAFAYGRSPRVAPIICQGIRGGDVLPGAPTNKGEHGYDIDDPEMTALFLVNGPAFRRDARIPVKFDNVDLYPMLARLVGVAPLPNDGNAATLAPLLAAR
ncbi:alkaline phosphatase family protein [Sphingomonas immobilis]|nr:ectonucleotide pyrophosphatase/phosphodiesterase [Sphingomonas sp. CA1-15]